MSDARPRGSPARCITSTSGMTRALISSATTSGRVITAK